MELGEDGLRISCRLHKELLIRSDNVHILLADLSSLVTGAKPTPHEEPAICITNFPRLRWRKCQVELRRKCYEKLPMQR